MPSRYVSNAATGGKALLPVWTTAHGRRHTRPLLAGQPRERAADGVPLGNPGRMIGVVGG